MQTRSWITAAMLVIAALPGCGDDSSTGGSGGAGGTGTTSSTSTTTSSTTTTSSSTTTTSSSSGGGDGGGGAGQGGGGGSAPVVCGDGAVDASETCDDGNTTDGDGCAAACVIEAGYACTGAPSVCTPSCGDGQVVGAEACDDGNANDGDGCTAACAVESGYDCTGAPSVCATLCGDGLVVGAEACDDTNTIDGDGCTAACVVEAGYTCTGAPSTCATTCGDGIPAGTEACDDGNTTDGDGCAAACAVESGYTCTGAPSACATVCGDGQVVGAEACDDGNAVDGDGCAAACAVEAGYTCTGAPSACATVCGDGLTRGAEACDDGNLAANDGCDALCAVEAGWICAGDPSLCAEVCGDGTVVGDEACDDGNTVSGDGCSDVCAREIIAEVEPNDTPAQADANPVQIAGSSVISGAIGTVGDKDLFRVTLAADSVVRFESFDASANNCAGVTTVVRILNASGTERYRSALTETYLNGISGCGALVVNLPAGTYYAQVEETGNNATVAAYTFEVSVQASAGSEVEPNDSRPTATPIAGSDVYMSGGHQIAADFDVYAVTIPAGGGSIRAETIEGSAAETCESLGIDTFIDLFNEAGTSLASDDDGGRGFCSLIDGTGVAPVAADDAGARNLAPGMYYIQVRSFSTSATNGNQFDYRLAITVR